MELFVFGGAGGGDHKSLVKVGEGFEFDRDMELSEPFGAEAEFAAGDTPGIDAMVFETTEPGVDGLGEFEVIDSGEEVDPDFVEVHG